MAINAIYSICETDVTEVRSKEFKSALSKGNIDGKRTLKVVPTCHSFPTHPDVNVFKISSF